MPTNILPNLVDWANLADPQGVISDIANLLAQSNDVLKDIVFQEANAPLSHKVTVTTGLPQGTWRGNNQGVGSTKMTSAQYSFNIGELYAYSKVDRSEAELYGQKEQFRLVQDQAHIEGLSQQVATTLFYGNETVTPEQFTGFSAYYNTTNTATAQTARNVVNFGGTGNSNASAWFVGWGDNTCFGLFPKGSTAGLLYEDKGDVREIYDNNGNAFEGYTSWFRWKIGLCVKNWQYNVRIANIDTTSAGLLGANPASLNEAFILASNKVPTASKRFSGIETVDDVRNPKPGVARAIYVNRSVKAALEVEAIRSPNAFLRSDEYAGEPVTMWRDCPVRVTDALINTESTVS